MKDCTVRINEKDVSIFSCSTSCWQSSAARTCHTRVPTVADSSNRREINPLMPNDPYSGRTAPLTSKRCILYIYSTNIGTEYFNHGIYSPSFPLQNAICFIILTYLFPVLFTFYIQGVVKLKKKTISAPNG